MEISYKLDNFEGPLDLLLHLIEKNKVSIYDIPIVLITEQYLEYVNQMDHEDLDVVSDFLVMAATLLDIKSRMLLPKVEKEEEEDEELPEEEEDEEPFTFSSILASVFAPAMPSTSSPFSFWKFSTAVLVPVPKLPSLAPLR